MKQWLPLLVAVAIAFVLGLMVGLRGCDGGATNKLLQENAELKQEVTNARFLIDEAEKRRAEHAVRRNAAERKLKAVEIRETAAVESVVYLRRRVGRERKERDTRDDLIDALDKDIEVKKARIDLLYEALTVAELELEEGHAIEASLNKALLASEKRADKLEKHVMKDRKKKIAIGVGSAAGGILLAFGATYAATRVQ